MFCTKCFLSWFHRFHCTVDSSKVINFYSTTIIVFCNVISDGVDVFISGAINWTWNIVLYFLSIVKNLYKLLSCRIWQRSFILSLGNLCWSIICAKIKCLGANKMQKFPTNALTTTWSRFVYSELNEFPTHQCKVTEIYSWSMHQKIMQLNLKYPIQDINIELGNIYACLQKVKLKRTVIIRTALTTDF